MISVTNIILLLLLIVALLWILWHYRERQRIQQWLLDGANNEPPGSRGWREFSYRLQRVVRDIRAENAAFRIVHEQFLQAIEAMPNGVMLLDEQGRVEWLNHAACVHWGLDVHRDLGQHVVHLVRIPAFVSHVQTQIHTRIYHLNSEGESEAPSSEPLVIETNRPGPQPERVLIQSFAYAEKKQLLLSQDVSERERTEQIRRDFVANVSHEIRTPLTVLAGFIETFESLPLSADEQKRYLGMMSEQSHRMQTLVEDLLALARLEGSPKPDSSNKVVVQDIMRLVLEEARSLSRGRHTISMEPGEPCEIIGDRAELMSALSNLVINAVRYTPDGGNVSIAWNINEQGEGIWSVTDSGLGIAAEHIPRLTERFYRVDRSRSRESGGTGLGLAIVKHILQRHNAKLVIQSQPGQGSAFSMVFAAGQIRRVL